MNQELTTNPFNPLAAPKQFDEIKISLASPEYTLSLHDALPIYRKSVV